MSEDNVCKEMRHYPFHKIILSCTTNQTKRTVGEPRKPFFSFFLHTCFTPSYSPQTPAWTSVSHGALSRFTISSRR